ncbi:MAG: hypothetical protein ACI9ES_002234, partial [Oceanospirillaceae bacterium]
RDISKLSAAPVKLLCSTILMNTLAAIILSMVITLLV